jgi:hypothetical protein
MRRTGKTVLALVTLSLANSCESIDLLAFPEPGDPHFGDLTGQAMEQPDGRWLATVTVTVHGADENLKEGVTVGASWSTGASGSCITGSDGQCPISLSLPDSTSTVMFKVDSLSRDSDSYAPASNDISNTVTVSMPATGETIVPEWFADHEDHIRFKRGSPLPLGGEPNWRRSVLFRVGLLPRVPQAIYVLECHAVQVEAQHNRERSDIHSECRK